MSDLKPNFTRVTRKTAAVLDLSVGAVPPGEMMEFEVVRRAAQPVLDLSAPPAAARLAELLSEPSEQIGILERLRRSSETGTPDTEAWASFVELYRPMLTRWLQARGVQPAEIECLLQDVLTAAHRNLSGYRGDAGHFRSWLFAVARDRVTEFFRHRQQPAAGRPDPPAADGPDVDQADYRKALIARWLELTRPVFSGDVWRLFEMTMLEGRSPADVARELDLEVNAVHHARLRVLTLARADLAGLLS